MNNYKKTKTGLFVPQEDKEKKRAEQRQKFLDEYKLEHKYCPKCYSSHHETTLMGCIQTDPFEYRDSNHSYCRDCDWKGRVYERVPYNTYQGQLEYERKKYDEQHKFCPECGNEEITRTCVGSLSGKDTNKAICDCGWVGIVDGLVESGWFEVWREPLLGGPVCIGRAKAGSFEEACYKVVKEQGWASDYDWDSNSVFDCKLFSSEDEYYDYSEKRGY